MFPTSYKLSCPLPSTFVILDIVIVLQHQTDLVVAARFSVFGVGYNRETFCCFLFLIAANNAPAPPIRRDRAGAGRDGAEPWSL